MLMIVQGQLLRMIDAEVKRRRIEWSGLSSDDEKRGEDTEQ
jgi:hypothetical protein